MIPDDTERLVRGFGSPGSFTRIGRRTGGRAGRGQGELFHGEAVREQNAIRFQSFQMTQNTNR